MRDIQPFFRRSRSVARAQSAQTGMTLLELILACAILMVLASSAVPVARFTVRRQKEMELHRDLREMRDAIDRYKDASDRNLIRVAAGTEGYPPDLETLVTGVDITAPAAGAPSALTPAAGLAPSAGAAAGPTAGTAMPFAPFGQSNGVGTDAIRHVRFLRRIPVDPMTGHAEWGLRAVQDDTDSRSWGGHDVFDVFSQSTGTALDNTKYSNW